MSGEQSGPDRDGRLPDGVPDFTGPPAAEPEFLPCYQHADRPTGITCQRCRRPICMQCMNEASVGFHCPECAGVPAGGSAGGSAGGPGRRSGGNPVGARTRPSGRSAGSAGDGFLARLKVADTPVTWALVAVCVLVALVNLVTRDLLTGWLALSGAAIEANQWWRMLTFAVTSIGMFGPAINALIMVLIGRSLEPLLGGPRFLTVYLTGCLVGGALFVILSQGAPFGVTGMSAGTIGLIAASAAVKLRMGYDIRFDLVLLGLLVVLSVIAGFGSNYWVTQVGGILGGGGAALIMLFAPARSRVPVQTAGIAAVWVLSFIAAAISVTIA